MSEVTKYFEQAISRWLDKEKANDELFADQVTATVLRLSRLTPRHGRLSRAGV